MNAIREIKNRLKKYPQVKFEETSDSIYIFPENDRGFTVGLEETSSEYTVSFEGWHETFNDIEEALECFSFGLSNSCRLKITYRGTLPQKWELESKENNKWVTDSTTGLLIFPFWRKPLINYKQNNLIKVGT